MLFGSFDSNPNNHPTYSPVCPGEEVDGVSGFMTCQDRCEREAFIQATCKENPFREQSLRESKQYIVDSQGSPGLNPKLF
jgi:hypothetical protein